MHKPVGSGGAGGLVPSNNLLEMNLQAFYS